MKSNENQLVPPVSESSSASSDKVEVRGQEAESFDETLGASSDTAHVLQNARELLRVAICPECDGSGAKQVQTSSRQYVTREMAMDAGDRSMEGSLYSDDAFEVQQCQWCDERKTVLESSVPDESKSDTASCKQNQSVATMEAHQQTN